MNLIYFKVYLHLYLVPSMYPWMDTVQQYNTSVAEISVKLLLVLLNRAKYMFTH